LQHPANRNAMSFDLRDGGYDTRDHQVGDVAPERKDLTTAGWVHRRMAAQRKKYQDEISRPAAERREAATPSPASDPFAPHQAKENVFDPAKQQFPGVVLGIAMVSIRTVDGTDHFYAIPGDDVVLTTFTAGERPQPTPNRFTIVDLYESKMSEYDSSFVFVPIHELQKMRGMIDPSTGVGLVNSIQIQLKPGANGDAIRDKLRAAFRPELYSIYTWRDKQGPLLAAVHMETMILNILLFLIIAVAGFGILAIFYMIVVEKTRDIGILKSLGASSHGVMGIFLAYGLSLGIVGSGVGMISGLLIVTHINQIADILARITGQPVFDPSIYYFYKIPAIVEPMTVVWIVVGALGIAVAASVLPARRAARLHPVEALRYE
jgi:lipoprotein-releasing system permease protein